MKPSKLLARLTCSSSIEPELSTTNRKSIFLQPSTGSPESGSTPLELPPTSNLGALSGSSALAEAEALPVSSEAELVRPVSSPDASTVIAVIAVAAVAEMPVPTEADTEVPWVSRPPSESPQVTRSSAVQMQGAAKRRMASVPYTAIAARGNLLRAPAAVAPRTTFRSSDELRRRRRGDGSRRFADEHL